MEYPKPYMSITELVKYSGLSRAFLKNISISTEAPIIKTAGGGKILFVTEELDPYIKKVYKARSTSR
jgi:hypothetical protein